MSFLKITDPAKRDLIVADFLKTKKNIQQNFLNEKLGQSAALQTVARATTTARLLYAAPAWWGLTTAEDRLRLERFHNKMQRLGFLPPDIMSVDALVRDIEGRLLRAVMRQNTHVLLGLFPPRVHRPYSLRPRPHSFELPRKDDINYISRVLYRHSTMAPTF